MPDHESTSTEFILGRIVVHNTDSQKSSGLGVFLVFVVHKQLFLF